MKLITLLIYLLLTISWIYILYFSTKEIIKGKFSSKSLFTILFVILIIDSIRTLIESIYFGTRLASQYGMLSKEIFTLLSNPLYLFIPKFINAIAAISIIFLIFKKWYPKKLEEDNKLEEKFKEERKNKEKLALLNRDLDKLVSQKTQELEELNQDLERRISEELEKNRLQEQKIFEQSKMAAMGEMLQNIAHQWRQPLSVITTSSSGSKYELELGMIDEKLLKENLELITKTGQHLSQTIDDFQNFFKPDKKITEFKCEEVVERVDTILSASFKTNNISLIIEKNCNCTITGYYNEYIQVLMNILSNAKHAVIENNDEVKIVKIDLDNVDGYCCINVTDNGGGIPESIINRIFEPYFTTKHKSSGTGIGLYMSKEIVEKHLNGVLEASNVDFTHEGEIYKGAKFTVKVKTVNCCKI